MYPNLMHILISPDIDFVVPVYLINYLCIFSAEKCDPNDPNNWWNQPPVEVYPYSGGFAEDAAAEAPASESGSSGTVAMKVTEDSFGTNNQVSILGINTLLSRKYPTVLSR